jgi:hypothetical protein
MVRGDQPFRRRFRRSASIAPISLSIVRAVGMCLPVSNPGQSFLPHARQVSQPLLTQPALRSRIRSRARAIRAYWMTGNRRPAADAVG